MGGFSMPGFSPEPVSGDSLTRAVRSTTNQIGQTGTNFINAGMPVFNSGVTGAGTAQGTAGTALQTLDPAIAFYKAILSGDPTAINTAIAPASSTLATSYQNALKSAQMFMPRGGARASMVTSLPFQQSQDLFNLVSSLKPQAAAGLNTASGTQANIGGLQGNLAQLLMQGGLGTASLGSGMLNDAIQAMLARRGQNVAESGQNKSLAGSLGGSLLTGSVSPGPYGTSVSWSDRRLKRDLKLVGSLRGVPVYVYRYLWSDEPEIGVMGHDLEKVLPSAVIRSDIGPAGDPYRMVDYGKVARWIQEV